MKQKTKRTTKKQRAPKKAVIQNKKRPFFILGVATLVIIGCIVGIGAYMRSLAFINLTHDYEQVVQPWWQDYAGTVVVADPKEGFPWYTSLFGRRRSSVTITAVSNKEASTLPGERLLEPDDAQSLYVMDPYVFFIPMQQGEEGQQQNLNVANPILGDKLQVWLRQLYAADNFTILINGSDDCDIFAFLTLLYSVIAEKDEPPLTSYFSKAEQSKEPGLIGFASSELNRLDPASTFFTNGPGRLLVTTLSHLEKQGYLAHQWQYYTLGDLENQLRYAEVPRVLFGPYSFKKSTFVTPLLSWRMKTVPELLKTNNSLFPLKLLRVSLNGRTSTKADKALFSYLQSKPALQQLNEKTPFLSISLKAPLLNKDHRLLLDNLLQSSAVPCAPSSLQAQWLKAFRELIRRL
jgi:hypothetical protein